jgi:hypothetical protein
MDSLSLHTDDADKAKRKRKRARKAKAQRKPRAPAPVKPADKLIGTLEVAAKLGCHPMSIPRFVKTKPGFPQPAKLFNKNLWGEAVVDAYVATLMGARAQVA